MKDQKVVDQILDYIPTINFDNANYTGSISLFETTIRYLGGLLSGEYLLSPFVGPMLMVIKPTIS